MLGTPINGWAEIKIGQEKIGNASYLTDPAMDCLDAFLRYFDTNSFLPFGLIFDAEGYYFGIMEFADYLYIADDKTDDDKLNLREINPIDLNLTEYAGHHEILTCLAKECVNDIVDNLEGWVHWFTYANETEENLEKRRQELLSKIKHLKNYIS